jgi:hypothetical protein
VTRFPEFAQLILAIDASTGDVINLVRDQNGPWLYVMAAVLGEPMDNSANPPTGELPVMLVVDSRSMEIVGEIQSSGWDCDGGLCEGAVAAGPDGVFFVTTGSATVVAFDGGGGL